ncbi:phosphatidate cytidylyltransferase [uncultured Jatrophihabitans sp.]|uniref:phosphatidate cytidylyltransferase n=1 Tax=uncultured Jatrophihabitans sp. TaxID=1610747 RepID=UPI0035CB2F48
MPDEREPIEDAQPQDAARSPLGRARRLGGPAVQQRTAAPVPRRSGPLRAAAPDAVAPGTAPPAAAPEAAAPDDVTAPGAPGSRAGRNLPAAIGVGVGLGAVILVSLFAYRPSFAVIVGLAVLYGCWEMTRALRSAQVHVSLLPVVVGAAATLVAAWERGPSGLVLAVLLTFVAVLAWRIGDGAEHYARDVAASAFTIAYLPMLAGFAVLLAHPHDGAARVLAFVATVVCSDTGGYATGVLFGKHPLAPIVSKGKTWEGFAGSVVACAAAGVLFCTLTFHEAWWKGLLFGLAIVVTATLGDLGESMIKRDLQIKDMGALLPGHGGLMDRLDSLLPCAAVAYLLLSAFAPV